MIKDKIIVKRYAEAFWAHILSAVPRERAMRDTRNLKGIIRDNPGFLEFLESPQITYAEKCSFLDKVLNSDFLVETGNFIKLLLKKERVEQLVDIIEYLRVAYLHEGETEVLLKTSYPLDVDIIRKIQKSLENKFRKNFRFYIDLDGSLLGGIQAVIGNTVIDGSVRKRLDDLKEKLKTVKVS